MSKLIHTLILLIIPVFFLLLSLLFTNYKGEFYLRNMYDPSYVYLINSLNLAQLNGYGVGHIDHPGTPVQAIGAVVIYLLHLNVNLNKDIVTDVFDRPEFYISSVNSVFIFMNSIALFILGFVTFRKLKNIYPAILLQLTPLFLITIFYWITSFSSEPLLVFAALLLLTIIISYTSEEDLKTISIIMYIIGFGLICGFGLATKMTFFPLLIIPIVLINRISFKVLFCLITLLAFFVFVLPAVSADHPDQFLNWLKKIASHSGKYGQGEENFVDTYDFRRSLKAIFIYEPVFSYSYILISLTFLLQLIPKFKQKIKSNKYHNLLTGIFVAMTIQILIVSKHFEMRYLIPAYMLIILGLYVVNSIAIDLFPNLSKINKFFYLSIILIIFSIIQLKIFLNSGSQIIQRRDESRSIIKYIEENCKQFTIVTSYGASSKEYALHLGATYGGSRSDNYFSILRNMFPNYYYSDEIRVTNNLINSKKFMFQCSNEIVLNDFIKIVKEITGKQNVTFKNVFSNPRGEAIYEIDLGYN